MPGGMDFLVKAVLEKLDPETRAALEAVPRNIAILASRLESIDNAQRLTAGILQNLSLQLQRMESKLDPAYTPEFEIHDGGKPWPKEQKQLPPQV